MIVPRLECAGEAREGNAKFVKQPETVQMTGAIKILGCSSTTSNIVLRSETLGMYPLKTNRDATKLKRQYKIKNMPEKRLPIMVDNAVGEKITKRGSWNKIG